MARNLVPFGWVDSNTYSTANPVPHVQVRAIQRHRRGVGREYPDDPLAPALDHLGHGEPPWVSAAAGGRSGTGMRSPEGSTTASSTWTGRMRSTARPSAAASTSATEPNADSSRRVQKVGGSMRSGSGVVWVTGNQRSRDRKSVV